MQSSPSAIFGGPDLEDMGQKESNKLLERLTARVTAIEERLNRKKPESQNDGRDRTSTIALGVSVLAIIAVPVGLFAWLEPHLHADLNNEVTIEVSNQLKDPLKQIGEIAGDVREIKGKLEILDPLIQKLTVQRMGEVKNLTSKDLVARLPELKQLATIAKTANVTVKPETVEEVGTKLIAVGSANAWDAAIDFLNYKSFLNTSLEVRFNNVIGNGKLTTTYRANSSRHVTCKV